MTKEQQLDWLCRLRSEIYVYMPQEWIKKMDEALTQSIKALEQEPCDDAVSRQAVDDYIVKLLDGYLYDEERTRLENLCAYLWELPPVTQKPETVTEFADRCRECGKQYVKRQTGHWIKVTNGRGGHECDICHEYAPSYQDGDEYLTKYCPSCGAKMVEQRESESDAE